MKTKMILAMALTLVACGTPQRTTAQTSQPAALAIETYTGTKVGFLVNSHLIKGSQNAILVDAQFTRSEARKVIEMIKKSGKELQAIVITHGHPDHYLGLELITKEFPKAEVLASKGTIDDIKATAQLKINYWKTMEDYKNDLAADDSFVKVLKPLRSNTLELDGESIQVVDLGAGESEHAIALYLPSTKELITGDLAYSGVHLWLQEDRPEGWLKNLAQVKTLGEIKRVYPGHGVVGNQNILKANEKYIRDFERLAKPGLSKEQAVKAVKDMTKLYGKYALPVILDLSVGARVK